MRDELRYPIGIQSFPEIREDGWTYVDKTHFIPLLLKNKYYFLSRPRRFGKSLFLSTLEAYFTGRRELFNGLKLDSMDVEWTPHPVLYFDLNSGVYDNVDGLVVKLHDCLAQYEERYGMTTPPRDRNEIPIRFSRLIQHVYEATQKKVVILIDEYDKPLLGLEENEEVFIKSQILLKSFFGNLKSMDAYIRFAFITGVARFSKVSIFSDINHLKDITLDDRFADICGWSEEELTATFGQGIEALAEKRKEPFEATLEMLRNYYDGYLFTPEGSRLYNPYSVLRALDAQVIDPYWFDSGTPFFLVKLIRSQRIDPMDITGRRCTKHDLMQVRIGSKDPIPLMFQSGYLTIDTYDAARGRYTLRFPNREVEKAFAEDLLPMYVKDVKDSSSPFSLFKFEDDLNDGDPESFMVRLATMFKDMPYDDQCEAVYRAVTYLICKLCTLDPRAEQHSYRGRSDLEVLTTDYIYLFEFKYDESVDAAFAQIRTRDYSGRYALDKRQIFLIGANYTNSKENRGLQFEIQSLS